MADWQGIALVISSTTALLAVGAPFALRWWDEKDRRKQEKKQQIEEHLFFVLDNYVQQWTRGYNWIIQMAVASRNNEAGPGSELSEVVVEGFISHLVRLRTLKQIHQIDDAGFCSAVEKYLGRGAMPGRPDSTQDEMIAAMNRYLELDTRINLSAFEGL